jgi:molybdopterin-biosynthesis enzyme MoeA-like protein
MNQRSVPSGFGLIVIGNEILDGRREDRHDKTCRELLLARNIPPSYTLILPDDPDVLESQFKWAMARPEPFFCCGGIGSTPDDYTRLCAGRAAGVSLKLHPDGVAILKGRFGREATPARLEMVNIPLGASLVPNPVNRIPGFHIANGYFLPGFPEMAAPMMAWVLDNCYMPGEERASYAVVVRGCREADLVGTMEAFMAANPEVSFSSLPRFGELELGVSGPVAKAEAAYRDLLARVDELGLEH